MKNSSQENKSYIGVNFGPIYQTNNKGGDATKQNQEEILKILHTLSNGKEEEWLQAYFGDDWKKALANKQIYNNLKKKLLESHKSLDELLKEKEEILEKLNNYHLNLKLQEQINSAIAELRYEDAEKLLADYLNSSKDIAKDREKAHYQKALVHLEKIEYYKAKDEIEYIPQKKVEDPKLLNDYARIYELCGDYKEALPLYEKALAISEKVLGKEHPSTAASYNNLALFYFGKGDLEKAQKFMQKAVDVLQKVLPSGHPNLESAVEGLMMIEMLKMLKEQGVDIDELLKKE